MLSTAELKTFWKDIYLAAIEQGSTEDAAAHKADSGVEKLKRNFNPSTKVIVEIDGYLKAPSRRRHADTDSFRAILAQYARVVGDTNA